MSTNNKTRPYWHVDLKWIFGILTTFFLIISLLLFTLSTLTAEKTAIPLASFVVASQFSKNGLDDATEIETLKNKFFQSGQEVFYPLGGKDVSITKSEIQTLSPRKIRLKIFRQVVEPFYYGNISEETKKQAGLLAFLNQSTHKTINQIFLFSIIPVIISFAGLIFFSYRYGRLISPAVVFLYVSTLPAAFLFVIANARSGKGDSGPIPFLPHEAVQEIAATIATPYQILFFTGIGLLIAVPIMKIIKKSSR